MDAVTGSRPGFVYDAQDDEASAQAAYNAHREYLKDAWRTGSASVGRDRTLVSDQTRDNNVERARENYKKRMSDAWRTTGGTGFGPGSFGA